jgi:hypothetical protein
LKLREADWTIYLRRFKDGMAVQINDAFEEIGSGFVGFSLTRFSANPLLTVSPKSGTNFSLPE